jgi:hypothetical protein
MTLAVAAGAPQILEAMQRFIELSEVAIRACDAGDESALVDALDARDFVAARVGELTNGVRALRGSGRSIPPESLVAVQRCANEVVRVNAALALRVAAIRDETQRALSQVNHDDNAVAGYARSMPRARQLDLTR